MTIRIVSNPQTIKMVKRAAIWIPIEADWKPGDMILFYEPKRQDDDEFAFLRSSSAYEDMPIVYTIRDKYSRYAVKTTTINDVSMGTMCFFGELFKTYNEISDVECVLEQFEALTEEKLCTLMSEIIGRAKIRKVINDIQEQILIDIFNNKKSKKQLVDDGVCTFEEIERAYSKLYHELQYLYGFNNKCVEARAKGFYGGELKFKNSIGQIAESCGIEVSLLKSIARRIVKNDSRLSSENGDFVLDAIEYDSFEEELNGEERKRLVKIAKEIIQHYDDCETEFYTAHAELLIRIKHTHSFKIKRYCERNGLNAYMISRIMEKLGVRPDTHTNFRHTPISDYFYD